MKAFRPIRKCRSEAGIALLISIFVLLLISVVAIAVVVSSGTESALTGNYRSSTEVYYAALGGIEEARARLRPRDPRAFQVVWPAFFPSSGAALPVGTLCYLLNASPSDDYATMLTVYPDSEYDTEFGSGKWAAANGSGNVNTTRSFWSGLNGPLYKWARINAVSEQSLNLDVDADGQADSTTPLYYDSGNGVFSNNPNVGPQALELTALAVLPNGSQKLLQYIVAPNAPNLTFPAALTLAGNNPIFKASPSPSFWVRGGADQGTTGTCNPTAPGFPPLVPALGYTDTTYSTASFEQPGNPYGILSGPSPGTPDLRNNYTNGVNANPDLSLVTLAPNLSTAAGLNNLVQAIEQNADLVVNGNATQANMPSAMSASNPMTIVINGDLTFNGWRNTGYGLLLVTGKFTYDPDASWNGIILVIGQGNMYSHQGSFANTAIQGAVFIANTAGGSSTFDFYSTPNNLQNGIFYSSCWIQAAQPAAGYKILSFHEISQ